MWKKGEGLIYVRLQLRQRTSASLLYLLKAPVLKSYISAALRLSRANKLSKPAGGRGSGLL